MNEWMDAVVGTFPEICKNLTAKLIFHLEVLLTLKTFSTPSFPLSFSDVQTVHLTCLQSFLLVYFVSLN